MLIPDNIRDFNSTGEKILYMKFKNDGSTNSMFVLHSLFTNHHIKNISGELDFFVIAPGQGFFSIEVKHGGISRKNGEWCFTNREGKTTFKKTSPFAQQSATINSIRKFVLSRIEQDKALHQRFSKILWGSGVAFTSMNEFVDFGPEGHSWQILTKQGLNLPIGSYIESLSNGAHSESEGKFWYDANNSRPTKNDCELLLKILRGDFEVDYSEINRINDADNEIEEYTKEQFALLEFVRYNKRCLVQGCAGTGKTLMALELLRQKTEEGNHVGLFCFNTQLGAKLFSASQKIENDNIKFCGTLHSFMVQNTQCKVPSNEDELRSFYAESLPFEFLISSESLSEESKLDFLILDEAQDLITPYYLEVFDLILKGGIRNGDWAMFGDFSNQAIYQNNPTESKELLNSSSDFTTFPPLKINCRNTKEIACQNTLLTGAQVPEFTSKNYSGKHVICKYPTKSSRLSILIEILKNIEKRKIPWEKVTLLSPKKLENSIASDNQLIRELIKLGLNTSTIQGFKGLENAIIVLYDFDEITSVKMQRLIYVGISRAKQELYLILDKSQEEAVGKLIQENYPKLN
ncbi:MAG: NERD domain-containing protein [Marinoscillum sp.]